MNSKWYVQDNTAEDKVPPQQSLQRPQGTSSDKRQTMRSKQRLPGDVQPW